MTKGYGAPEVGEACARAEDLCRQIGDERQLLPSLWRLGVFYEVRGEFGRQEQIASRLLELARRTGDPATRLSATMMLSPPAIHRGELRDARERLEEAIGLADSLDARGLVETFGQNQQVTPRGFLAWVMALLDVEGRPQALIEEALRRGRRVLNPIDEAFALFFSAFCAAIQEDAELAQRRADEVTALSVEHGLPLFAAMGTMIGGWAAGARGEPKAGADAVAEGLAAFEATGARMMLHFYFALLADTCRRAGRLEQALVAVEDGLSNVDATSRFFEAELYRLKGELLLALEPERPGEAEAALREALALALAQDARTLERRARATLGRLAG